MGPTGYAPQPRQSLPPAQQRYEAKTDPDVYYLPDHANNTIPEDIRGQFQCDTYGRVLFFTAPPVETEKKVKLGHTAKYLAWRAERDDQVREKRKLADAGAPQVAKRAKSEEVAGLAKELEKAKERTLERMNELLAEGTVRQYQALYGEKWREALEVELKALEGLQDRAVAVGEGRSAAEGGWRERDIGKGGVVGMKGALEFGVKQ